MHSLFLYPFFLKMNNERDYIGRLLINVTWDEWREVIYKPGWLTGR